MTEAERNSFLHHSLQRAPGKRQIKPVGIIDLLPGRGDDSEDDADFKIDLNGSGDESSSESSSDGEAEEEDQEAENSDDLDDAADDKEFVTHASGDLYNSKPVCSICLNQRQFAVDDEVMECDKCGLAVHECCYTNDVDVAENRSTQSSSSTEPWFCEPCVYGLTEPPHCELCPSRYGAFKRSDIGCRWVHLVCALYTPGVTFGDVVNLSAISWQEVDYKRFGKKSCVTCSNRLESRVGLVSDCDAALCKHRYHVTCAQRLGFLDDKSDHENNHDSRFIHCKHHSAPEDVRRKREAYNRFLRHEERRMVRYGRGAKKLSEREEETRQKMLDHSMKVNRDLIGTTIAWPDHTGDHPEKKMRRGRLLHTSPHFLEAFAEKASLLDIDREEYEKPFVKQELAVEIKIEQIPFLPPGFSTEFVSYYEHRDKRLKAEESHLQKQRKENERLYEEQNAEQRRNDEAEREKADAQEKTESVKARLEKLLDALHSMGFKKIPVLAALNSSALPKKATVGRKRTNSVRGTGQVTRVIGGSPLPAPVHAIAAICAPEECDTCNQRTDLHLLVKCDRCRKFYHLGCLDPPLSRMPRRDHCEWHCSNCVEEQEDEESEGEKEVNRLSDSFELEDVEVADSESLNRRKLRQRSDSVRARKILEAEDQHRAYRSAIARGSAPRRAVTGAVPKNGLAGGLNGRSSAPSAFTVPVSHPQKRFSTGSSGLKHANARPVIPLSANIHDTIDCPSLRSPTASSTASSHGSRSPVMKRGRRAAFSPSQHRRMNGRVALQEMRMEEEDDDEEKIIIVSE